MARTLGVHETAWGWVAAVWSDKGLWELSFPHPWPCAAAAALHHGEAVTGDSPWAAQLAAELTDYFAGSRTGFAVPVDWSGYTPFQAAVLRYTAGIPYGAAVSYGKVAAEIGSPKAARAVGGALHINRTPVVVPCHRVVGADGSLVGFGGGLDRKVALLELEKAR